MKMMAYVILLILSMILGLLGFWSLQNPKILGDQITTTVVYNVIKSKDEPLIVIREYCLLTNNYQGEVHRAIEDGIVYTYPIIGTNSEIGCKKRKVAIPIPPYMPDGEYVYKSTVIYDINPLKIQIIRLEPVKFTLDRGVR